MKNLIKYLNVIEEEIENCDKKSERYQFLLRRRDVVEGVIYLIMKNDQR